MRNLYKISLWRALAIILMLGAICPQVLSAQTSKLVIRAFTMPSSTVGVAFSTRLGADGGLKPYTWTLASGTLPSGISLATNGTISGTPKQAGTYNFTAKISDYSSPSQTAQIALTMKVSGTSTSQTGPSITKSLLSQATVNTAYTGTFSASGGTTPYLWSVISGQLPAGLSLDSVSGIVSGTPTVAGSSAFTVSVRDAGGMTASAATSLTVANTSTGTGPTLNPGEMWITKADLMARPMSGTAWTNMKNRADGSWGSANIADQNSTHDINTLAGALVFARTGTESYRTKVHDALMAVIGTDNNHDADCTYSPNMARSMAVGRNLTAYIVAADLIGMRPGTSADASTFANWVSMLRYKKNCPNTSVWQNLSQTHDDSVSNGSAMAGGSRIAAAIYLGDKTELDNAWQTYQRYLGDLTKATSIKMSANSNGLTWSYDPNTHPGVNPPGTTKSGHKIDGAIINDQGRGGAFQWPPLYTQYPWEGLQGMFIQAQMLSRVGYPSFTAMSNAPKRALDYQYWLASDTGNSRWTTEGTSSGHDGWVVFLANKIYGTSYPGGPATGGKNMAWTDWTHGK